VWDLVHLQVATTTRVYGTTFDDMYVRAVGDEIAAQELIFTEMRGARITSPSTIPLIVITRGQPDPPPAGTSIPQAALYAHERLPE
jgi:hypothetical protein